MGARASGWSARNRELLALIPVALLLTIGFAAVFAQNDSQLGNLSLSYGLYFLAVCLATHIYIRIRLPEADPYLFPLMALLTAFGLVMIYRLDAELARELARDQANWFVLGLVLFAVVIHFLRDYSVLERYRYTIALTGIALLLAPRLPLLGEQVNGAYLGVRIGPIGFQPAELAKICIVVFLASYLREHRELLVVGARRILGVTLPPLKHLGPLLVVWGAAMFMLIFIRDLGSSLMFFAAFLALLYVATGRFSFVVIGMAMFMVGAWVIYSTVPHVTDRVDIWLDPYQDPGGAGYQVLQSMFAQADGGLFGEGFARSMVVIPGGTDPLLPAAHTDLIYTLIVSELGLFGGAAVICDLPADRRPRLQDRTDGQRRILQTAGHGIDRGLRVPGFRDHRRSHQGDPADRSHPAVDLLRGQFDPRQLHSAGAVAAGIGPGAERDPPGRIRTAHRGVVVNARIIKLFAFIVVSFAVLIGFTSQWAVFGADDLRQQQVNKRPLFEAQQIKRGRITAGDGTLIARSVPVGQGASRQFVREYPTGGLFGHPVGYNFAEQGNSEFERFHNDELTGENSEFTTIFDELRGREQVGDNVSTSLDPAAQQTAFDLLAGRPGAVVAIEPSTGKVRAMVSQPPYDPNLVPEQLPELNQDPGSPLLNRSHPGPVPARIDVQAGHRDRGAGQRQPRHRHADRCARLADHPGTGVGQLGRRRFRRDRRHDRADKLGQHLLRQARPSGRRSRRSTSTWTVTDSTPSPTSTCPTEPALDQRGFRQRRRTAARWRGGRHRPDRDRPGTPAGDARSRWPRSQRRSPTTAT